jgi:hypothetical protein
MTYEIAKYIPSDNTDFQGNPFIECLPLRLTSDDFWETVHDLVDVPDDLHELAVETREQKAANIMKSVCPTSEYYDIYCDFLNILKEGLADRNPLDEGVQKWQNQVASARYEHGRTTAPSIKFTGYSGMGKTTIVNSVLSTIKPVFSHSNHESLAPATIQIVYIKIDIPAEADSKEICLMIAAQIDAVLGTNYEDQYEKLNRARCISKLVTLCASLLVGVIIFDEIHNICFAIPNERKMIFKLFDQLTQVARIPTLKIGTSKANRLSEKEFTNARRLGIPHEWRNYKPDSTDWGILINYAWGYQLTDTYLELTTEFKNKIYSLTQGIPHCLFFLIEQCNKYCLRNDFPAFTLDIIEHVYDTKFSIMKSALIALRHGKIDAFDDIMTTSKELDKEIQKLIKQLLKIAEENKFTGEEARAIHEQIEPYLPEYQLTQKEARTLKRLEKQIASEATDLPSDEDGYEGLPL